MKLFECCFFTETYISPRDPYRLFIDGDKYCPMFLFIICCQPCQRAWLNHAFNKGSFSVDLDLVLGFHLYRTVYVFFTYVSQSRRNSVCPAVSLLLESQGKPTLGDSMEGKLLPCGEDTNKNRTIAPLSCTAHSPIPNASPCWRPQIQYETSQWLSHPSARWCWAPERPHATSVRALASGTSKTAFFHSPFDYSPQAPSRVPSSITGSLGGRRAQVKDTDVSVHHLQPPLRRAGHRSDPRGVPALTPVTVTRGFPLIGFSDSAQGGRTDLPPCWVTTCSSFSRQGLCLRQDVPTQNAQDSGNMSHCCNFFFYTLH